MDHVDFITTETGDDLIVSFAICGDEPGEVRSVTLLRTPKYESIVDASERGVHVSDEDLENDDSNILESIRFLGSQVHIVTKSLDATASTRLATWSNSHLYARLRRQTPIPARWKPPRVTGR